MNKKRIYMVQPSSCHTGVMPLPYAIAVLHAYVLDNEEIMREFEFNKYIFEKKPIANMVESMREPFAVFFSCYIWNYEYNKSLAQAIKESFPQVKIVFGGHNVPVDYTQAFVELPFVDYIIIGEGELPFRDLLLHFIAKKDVDDLRNIAFRSADRAITCQLQPDYVTDKFVSPYQFGLFDDIVKKNKDKYLFSATLETNRGCPFGCAYCDWGLNKARVRFAPEQQILDDIAWIANNAIHDCYGADSNFGMFPRDARFAEAICEHKRKSGFPKTFFVSFSKNSDSNVLKISEALHSQKMLQGATLSFQSLNPDTLIAIGRKNLDLQYFSNIIKEYHKRRIPTYSELILGLPLETKESFMSGIGTLISCGQHVAIDVYTCCVLPNSDLGQKNYQDRFGIVYQRLPFRRFDVGNDEIVQEYSNIVVETSTMSKQDWRECNIFFNSVSALHFGKIFHCIALYLHDQHCLAYEDIYNLVIDTLRNRAGTIWYELYERMTKQLDAISEGNASWLFDWQEQQITESSMQNAIYKIIINNYSDYLSLVEEIMLSFPEPLDFVKQLVDFQAFCIKTRIDKNHSYKKTFHYNFDEYFTALYLGKIAVLEKSETVITGENMLKSIIAG